MAEARFTTYQIVRITLATGLSYFALGFLGMLLAVPPNYATIMWPASGVALGAVLVWRYFALPGLILGSLLVDNYIAFTTQQSFLLSVPLMMSLGVVLQASVGAYFIRRWLSFPCGFHRPTTVLKFLLIGGPLSCLINATLSCTTLSYNGMMAESDFVHNWLQWWVGDSIGVIISIPWLLLAFPQLSHTPISKRKVLFTALFTIAVTTFILSLTITQIEKAKQSVEFQNTADALANSLNAQLENIISTLHGLSAFVQVSNKVTPETFARYTQPLLQQNSALSGVSWDLAVSGKEAKQFVNRMQQQYGDVVFHMKERDQQGNLISSPRRTQHVIVSYIAPLEPNLDALGFDVYSQGDRRAALDRARRQRKEAVTGPISLIQDQQRHVGTLIFLPVFFSMTSESLLGYATAVLKIENLAKQSFITPLLPETDLFLLDPNAPTNKRLLYRSQQTDITTQDVISNINRSQFPLFSQTSIPIGSQSWQLVIVSKSAYTTHPNSVHIVIALGLLIAGLLSWFLIIAANHTSEITRQVELRTKELSQTNALLVKSELALTEAKDRAEQSSHTKTEFLANMSHELRTPIAAILSVMDMLNTSALNQNQRELTKVAQSSARSLLNDINDILEFSNMESGKLILEREPFSLDDIIENIATAHVINAEGKSIELICPANYFPALSLIGDPVRIQQVLNNLLDNAIKFTNIGEVSLYIDAVELPEHRYRLRFSVRDTGIGICPEEQPKLFHHFCHANEETSDKYGGTGLGLATCKQLVKLMDGEIGVTSQLHHGADFWFEIELDALPSQHHDVTQTDYRHCNALIFTENITVSEFLSDNLTHLQFNQIVAASSRCWFEQAMLSTSFNDSDSYIFIDMPHRHCLTY